MPFARAKSDGSVSEVPSPSDTAPSGTHHRVVMRPATVGPSWHETFQPGTQVAPPTAARVLVVADIVGALAHIHGNQGAPAQHRRHGRVTPRHILVGLDGSASLINVRKPFSHPLPVQPDLGYLAPEVLGETGPATARSDVFSAGVLLWEALDNGRLFPHRQASAISRLIARNSLPEPRVVEEWAHSLKAVAMRALAESPGKRQSDATALWRELRDCLPSTENARALLSEQVQELLQLSVTDQILDRPPYRTPSCPPTASDTSKGSGSRLSRKQTRYSMAPAHNETCVAQSKPRNVGPSRRPRKISAAPSSARRADISRSPRSEVMATSPRHSTPASQPSPAVDTVPVHIPNGLVNASLPYLLTSAPPARSATPWGLIALAGMAFFAVGAAVALGAINALRPANRSAPAPITVTMPPMPSAAVAAIPPPTSVITETVPVAPLAAPTQAPKAAASRQSPIVHKKRRPPSKRRRRTKSIKRRTAPANDLPFAKTPF